MYWKDQLPCRGLIFNESYPNISNKAIFPLNRSTANRQQRKYSFYLNIFHEAYAICHCPCQGAIKYEITFSH